MFYRLGFDMIPYKSFLPCASHRPLLYIFFGKKLHFDIGWLLFLVHRSPYQKQVFLGSSMINRMKFLPTARILNLDNAGQQNRSIFLTEGMANFMQHRPGRLISDLNSFLQLNGVDRVGLGNKKEGDEPL